MMKKTTLVVAGLLFAPLAFAGTVAPQNNNFSWTYADVGIATHDYDGISDNVTSLDGKLSYAIDQHIYALGGLSYGWVSGAHIWDLHGGLGFHTPLVNKLDLFGEGEVNLTRTTSGDVSDNENGYTLRAGVRVRATDKVELKGGIYHLDINGQDTGVFGSGLYHLNKQTDVGVRLTLGNDETAFGLFGRYNF